MKMPMKRPPLIDLTQRFHVLANKMSGSCSRKITINANMFVNIRDVAKKPIIRTNLALGSNLWMGLAILVNLNPSTNLSEI